RLKKLLTKALCNHLTQKPLFLQPVETLLKYNMDGKAPLQKEPLRKYLKALRLSTGRKSCLF
ncbi:hypothetical protein ABNE15_23125, partial [Paenibacillus larvae]